MIYRKIGKRFLDLLLSSVAIVLLSPVFLVTAILVRIKLGSPVLFHQERPGPVSYTHLDVYKRQGWIRLGQIYMRPITEADTDNIIGWRNSERVRRNFIYQEDFTRQGHQNWLKTKVATGEAIQFILCETQDDRPVGSVYFRDIDEKNRKAEYGIFIGEADAAGRCV